MIAAAKPGGVLMPVPTAVPPSGSSPTRGREARRRSTPYRTAAAYPPNSWPRVTGVASMRWVRPLLTTSANSSALRRARPRGARRAGIRSRTIAPVAATWIAEGKTSLDDCEAFTWSFGCTGLPSDSVASVAMTSLVFMLLDVPEPVWKTSMGKCCVPVAAATAAAASVIAPAMSRVEHAEVGVDGRGRALDRGERADQLALDGRARDREVLDGPLRLGPPLRPARARGPRPWSRARCGTRWRPDAARCAPGWCGW